MGALLGVVAAIAAMGAAAVWLGRPATRRRSPDAQAALERAIALVDRELAADLELMAMFDQTKQPFVLENGQFLAASAVIEREAPEAHRIVAEVYARIPPVETSMERRGPAGSIPDADLQAIHAWEGDAREAQRSLRSSLTQTSASRWSVLSARLRARLPAR